MQKSENEKSVEYIVDKRLANGKGNKNEYLVRWIGFDDSENKWINEQDLNCKELIEEFNTPRCVNIKKIITAYKNKNDQVFYTVVLANGLLENYPSSFLRRKCPEMLHKFLEKYFLFDKAHKNDIETNVPESIDFSNFISF